MNMMKIMMMTIKVMNILQAPKMGAHHGRGLEKKMTIYADDGDRLENNEDNYEYDEDNDDDDKGDEYIASS